MKRVSNLLLISTLGAFFAIVISSFSVLPSHHKTYRDTTFKPEPPQARVRRMDPKRDDIAWENDRIAFRIYGPALEKREPTGSGIDVWVKSVAYPVVEKWYAGGDYDNDKGEGLDFYGVGHSRGCGGLGVWDGQTLSTSGHWHAYQIKATDGEKAQFILDYLPWQLPGGRPISEHRTITLVKGTNLNRLESVFTCDTSQLIIGIGIAKIKGGEIYEDKVKGIMAFWPPENMKHGKIGCGVVVSAGDIVGFTEDKLNYLVLVKIKPGKPLVYHAGACWSRVPGFTAFDDWKHELLREAENYNHHPQD